MLTRYCATPALGRRISAVLLCKFVLSILCSFYAILNRLECYSVLALISFFFKAENISTTGLALFIYDATNVFLDFQLACLDEFITFT